MEVRIKELREELQLTQKEVAEKIDNVQRNVSNWENGTSEPDCENLVKLAELFGVSVDELLGRERAAVPPEVGDRRLLRAIRKLNDGQREALLRLLEAFGEPIL